MNLYFNTQLSVFQHDQTLLNEVFRRSGDVITFIHGNQVIPCSYGSSYRLNPRIDEVEFQDGYKQRVDRGLETPTTFDLAFKNVTSVVAKALERFFRGRHFIYDRNPSEWFYWVPPDQIGFTFTRPLKVTHGDATFTPNTFNAVNVSVTFTQSFEP